MKVSVLMITYNHGPYVAQAVESALMQQTEFPVEIIIGEDLSTDDTREIVCALRDKYPDKIKLFCNETNLGPMANFKNIYDNACGEYLAWLEGDDYWTDPHKLRKQVTFLDNNPECSLSFHNVHILDQKTGTQRLQFSPSPSPQQFTFMNLLGGNFIQSCSAVYRRSNHPVLPDWFLSLPFVDWPLSMLHAEKGPIGYLDEAMSVYRVLDSGMWANKPIEFRIKKSIEAAHIVDRGLNKKYTSKLGYTIVNWHNNLIDAALHRGDISTAFQRVFQSIESVDTIDTHSAFLTKYLSVFIDKIAHEIQAGNESEALALYTANINRIPYVNDLQKLDMLMAKLKHKLTATPG